MKSIVLGYFLILSTGFTAQIYADTARGIELTLAFDGYYSYSSSQLLNNEKEGFIYNHKRVNEFDINLALLKFSLKKERLRCVFTPMIGSYGRYVYSSEASVWQNIYEANIGVKLHKTKNIWLDLGILPSHIGFETAIATENFAYTRSILAENSPYFETGVKLSFLSSNEKHSLSLLALNGFQRINLPSGYSKISSGLQYQFKPKKDWTFNYSNFVGTAQADSVGNFRLFHNFYVQYDAKPLAFVFGFDYGTDWNKGIHSGNWLSPIFVIRYNHKDKWKLALRTEYYQDAKQIIVLSNTLNGFEVFANSLNFDLPIYEDKCFWRTEVKYYLGKDAYFTKNNVSSKENIQAISGICLKF